MLWIFYIVTELSCFEGNHIINTYMFVRGSMLDLYVSITKYAVSNH